MIVTRASNNYGPYQFPEKVIPLFITNAIDDIPVPLYGDGRNVRDWLHVRRPLPRDRSADRQRRRTARSTTSAAATRSMNVDLTHRILDGARQAALADQAGGRSPRPRSPLLPRHGEAACGSAGRRRCRSTRACATRSTGIATNEWWWRPIKEQDPAFKAYYRTQYETRSADRCLILVTGAAGFAGSHVVQALAGRRDDRRMAARVGAARRTSRGSRTWEQVDLLEPRRGARRRSRAEAVGRSIHCAGAPNVGALVARHRHAAVGQRPRHAPSARRAAPRADPLSRRRSRVRNRLRTVVIARSPRRARSARPIRTR